MKSLPPIFSFEKCQKFIVFIETLMTQKAAIYLIDVKILEFRR